MIAHAAARAVRPHFGNWNERFLAIAPIVEGHARYSFRALDPERRQEAIQEALAAALLSYKRLVLKGRNPDRIAHKIAQYAVLHVRNGRHVGGTIASRDVYAYAAQQRGGFSVQSLDRRADKSTTSWVNALACERRRASVADIVAARIDFGAWLTKLSPKLRRAAELLALGYRTQEAAPQLGVTPGRVAQMRRELEQSWNAFQRVKSAAPNDV